MFRIFIIKHINHFTLFFIVISLYFSHEVEPYKGKIKVIFPNTLCAEDILTNVCFWWSIVIAKLEV